MEKGSSVHDGRWYRSDEGFEIAPGTANWAVILDVVIVQCSADLTAGAAWRKGAGGFKEENDGSLVLIIKIQHLSLYETFEWYVWILKWNFLPCVLW